MQDSPSEKWKPVYTWVLVANVVYVIVFSIIQFFFS